MKRHLNLLISDLLSIKNEYIALFIYAIAVLIILNPTQYHNMCYIFTGFLISYMTINYIFVNEEKYHSDVLKNSLAIKKKDIVLVRYITPFLLNLLILILIGVVLIILHLFIPNIKTITLTEISLSTFMLTFYLSFYIPLSYKLGQNKTRFLSLLVTGAIIAPNIILGNLKLQDFALNKTANNISFNFVMNIALIIVSFIAISISFIISNHIYKNKEF